MFISKLCPRQRTMVMFMLLMAISMVVTIWHMFVMPAGLPPLCLPDYLAPQGANGESLCAWSNSTEMVFEMDLPGSAQETGMGPGVGPTNSPTTKTKLASIKQKQKQLIPASIANNSHVNEPSLPKHPKSARSVTKSKSENGDSKAEQEHDFLLEDTAQKIVAMAKNVTANSKGPLLLTVINKSFLPMTFNWLCHTANMSGVHERIIFLVQGQETQKLLKAVWPDVKTISVERSEDELTGMLKFGTVGYVRMMVRRTDLLNALIQANLSLVLFETDFIWFQDPVPEFIAMGEKEDLDLVGTVSTAETQIMCGAFIYFRNTENMRTLWAEVTRQMHALAHRIRVSKNDAKAPHRQNEQVFLNLLLEKKYAGARYGLVDYGSVVDGRWYKMKPIQRKKMTPKAIHNNFLYTSQQKIKRLQKFGQWVLNSNLTCDREKVEELFRRRTKL